MIPQSPVASLSKKAMWEKYKTAGARSSPAQSEALGSGDVALPLQLASVLVTSTALPCNRQPGAIVWLQCRVCRQL